MSFGFGLGMKYECLLLFSKDVLLECYVLSSKWRVACSSEAVPMVGRVTVLRDNGLMFEIKRRLNKLFEGIM